jgi:hypothetical protein
MAKLPQRSALDLAYSLAGHTQVVGNLFQCV